MKSDDLEDLERQSLAALQNARDLQALEAFRVEWLGRGGKLTSLLRSLSSLPLEKRKTVGQTANDLKARLEVGLEEKSRALRRSDLEQRLTRDRLDLSLPGAHFPLGHIHPITQVLEELVTLFSSMGFSRADGPEAETDFHNFEALNIPPEHPARDLQDTFYLALPSPPPSPPLRGGEEDQNFLSPRRQGDQGEGNTILLRTHTSPVQIRVMQATPPPIAIVAPGRVFRHEAIDATHSAVFHQLEGLWVHEDVSFADLKGTLTHFAKSFFGPQVRLRFRPSFFPFTEPSAEVDVSCLLCGGSGCRVCKETGWLEMVGAGMVHPHVFKAVGIDPDRFSGFAFGMGVERLAMFKYGIDDLRLFYENDIRFLEQF